MFSTYSWNTFLLQPKYYINSQKYYYYVSLQYKKIKYMKANENKFAWQEFFFFKLHVRIFASAFRWLWPQTFHRHMLLYQLLLLIIGGDATLHYSTKGDAICSCWLCIPHCYCRVMWFMSFSDILVTVTILSCPYKRWSLLLARPMCTTLVLLEHQRLFS